MQVLGRFSRVEVVQASWHAVPSRMTSPPLPEREEAEPQPSLMMKGKKGRHEVPASPGPVWPRRWSGDIEEAFDVCVGVHDVIGSREHEQQPREEGSM